MGKKSAIAQVALIVLAIAILSMWGERYAVLFIVAMVMFIVFGTFRSIDKTIDKAFAEGRPELAMMDGTEIIAHRKAEIAGKNTVVSEDDPVIPDAGHPVRALPPPEEER